ncbi:MAG: GNAT family N-acetyltransferase [Cytophagales bacterium]|nr:GNAT family N-acetyltransferase [Cytophagales bacterium]
MSVKVRRLNKEDLDKFIALIRVFEEVFEMEGFMMPGEKYLQALLAKEDFFVFVALLEDKVVGGLTAYTLQQYYSQKPLAYIYDLAVLRHYQRQGIGKWLMEEITAFCKGIGMEEVFVQADQVDQHAIEFYRATGGTAELVVHFYYPLNV